MSATSAFFKGKYVTIHGSENKTGVVVYPKFQRQYITYELFLCHLIT